LGSEFSLISLAVVMKFTDIFEIALQKSAGRLLNIKHTQS